MSEAPIITCTAPVNIAVIKYWGKRDESLILPVNDSVSVTLSSEQMHAKTSVTANANFSQDRIWLNGVEEPADVGRLASCLASVRAAASSEGSPLTPTAWCVHICSENNFPTAAGLASSAAGYACLVSALCKLYGIKGDISALARRGSGSACRSVLGGFVRWHMGNMEDGSDSIATQLAPASHWPGMRVLICVASDMQKKTSSSVGMRNSVKTSELLKYRAEYSVPPRTDTIVKAIEERDFQSFADITIRDSNQFHAICQDTYPPCVYMNPTSHSVSSLVHQVNTHYGEKVACYTFDAGPNACIFLLEKYVGLFASLLKHFFSDKDLEFFRGNPLELETKEELLESLDVTPIAGGLKYVIHTSPGEGPEVLGEEEALLDKNGMPKHLKA
jgi:diphosphomevalonate decarboxylase